MCSILFICHPLSSQLLLRISPNFFDYFSLSPMCLSSQNRSICKAFRHIMPYSAEVYKGMIYSKTGVPWQIKSTLIFIISLLKRHDLPHFARVSGIIFDKRNVRLSSGHWTNVHFMANRGKIRQSVTLKRIRTVYGYRVRIYA